MKCDKFTMSNRLVGKIRRGRTGILELLTGTARHLFKMLTIKNFTWQFRHILLCHFNVINRHKLIVNLSHPAILSLIHKITKEVRYFAYYAYSASAVINKHASTMLIQLQIWTSCAEMTTISMLPEFAPEKWTSFLSRYNNKYFVRRGCSENDNKPHNADRRTEWITSIEDFLGCKLENDC